MAAVTMATSLDVDAAPVRDSAGLGGEVWTRLVDRLRALDNVVSWAAVAGGSCIALLALVSAAGGSAPDSPLLVAALALGFALLGGFNLALAWLWDDGSAGGRRWLLGAARAAAFSTLAAGEAAVVALLAIVIAAGASAALDAASRV